MAEYLGAVDLEGITGIPASTWRYWAYIDEGKGRDDADRAGPPSVKIGRRRMWKETVVRAWLESLESTPA